MSGLISILLILLANTSRRQSCEHLDCIFGATPYRDGRLSLDAFLAAGSGSCSRNILLVPFKP